MTFVEPNYFILLIISISLSPTFKLSSSNVSDLSFGGEFWVLSAELLINSFFLEDCSLLYLAKSIPISRPPFLFGTYVYVFDLIYSFILSLETPLTLPILPLSILPKARNMFLVPLLFVFALTIVLPCLRFCNSYCIFNVWVYKFLFLEFRLNSWKASSNAFSSRTCPSLIILPFRDSLKCIMMT